MLIYFSHFCADSPDGMVTAFGVESCETCGGEVLDLVLPAGLSRRDAVRAGLVERSERPADQYYCEVNGKGVCDNCARPEEY